MSDIGNLLPSLHQSKIPSLVSAVSYATDLFQTSGLAFDRLTPIFQESRNTSETSVKTAPHPQNTGNRLHTRHRENVKSYLRS